MLDDSFVTFILDQLEGIEEVHSRRMFGGWGLYAGDIFFGIVSGERLYLKTNATTREWYVGRGMQAFAPSAKQVLKKYYEVPADVIEDREMLGECAREAVGVAAAGKR